MNRVQEQFLAVLAQAKLDWRTADEFVDELVPNLPLMRARGDT